MGLRGDRLKTIRELRGYTQEELAERMGVGTLQIYRWERRLGVRRAVLVTTARFSQETYYQARQMRIDLVDGEQFHQMRLKAHTPPISPALEPPHSEVPPSISEPDAVIRQLQDRMLKLNDPFLDDQKDDNWQLDSGHREP